jgi:hypothetical protein
MRRVVVEYADGRQDVAEIRFLALQEQLAENLIVISK